MPPVKGCFRNYGQDAMLRAIEDVQVNKMTVRAAARLHGVPRITLRSKILGLRPIGNAMGPPYDYFQYRRKCFG